MEIKSTAALAGALLAWNRLKALYDSVAKIAEPIVKEVEKRAQDGTIDRKDRKAIVMTAIREAEKHGTVLLNFISRIILSKVVDVVAGKLPDFAVSKDITGITDKASDVLAK